MCAYTLSHPHHSSPHTNILASLVKGEVLSPEKIRATTGGIALHPPTFPKPHYHLLCAITLASLVKGERLLPEKNSGDYRMDCSLSAPSMRFSALSHPLFVERAGLPLPLHRTFPFPQPLQKNNNPSLSTMSLPPLEKGEVARL